MISIEESQDLMDRLIYLRETSYLSGGKVDYNRYRNHEKVCVEKFHYLITMHTDKYKSFSNYEDLVQEGFVALLGAMKSYNPNLGNFFYWAHKYIETRIYRQANNHSTIRVPMKVAKINPPHKEKSLPLIVETRPNPETETENREVEQCVKDAVDKLAGIESSIIKMAFGISTNKPMSIHKICKKMKISRMVCITSIHNAIDNLKGTLKI
jgi:RNA polymerase sigma factor (sigma-70 family)